MGVRGEAHGPVAGEARISQDREAIAVSQATDAREGAGADLVVQLRAGDEAAVTWRRAARAAVVPRPALWARLEGSARVTVVSAAPGSGKTAASGSPRTSAPAAVFVGNHPNRALAAHPDGVHDGVVNTRQPSVTGQSHDE